MQNIQFNFKEFLANKGFKRVNERKFILEYSNEYHVQLEIENSNYIIPIGLSENFKRVIPKDLQQAQKEFETIASILDINFK